MQQRVISVSNGVTRHPLYRMGKPVDFCLNAGEQLAVVGPNGGGKSILIDIITGKYPLLMNEVAYDFSPSSSNLVSDNLRYITFRDSYGDADGTAERESLHSVQNRRNAAEAYHTSFQR